MSSSVRSDAEEHLLQVLHMVNEWLRFAETKNAGMLAFAGVSVGALLGFAIQVDKFHSNFGSWLLGIGAFLWGLTVVICTMSFWPKKDLFNILSHFSGMPEESDNIYYFRHLAKYEPKAVLELLGVKVDNTSPRSKYEQDLAQQVVTNSRIANSKLAAFEWATRFWLSGFVITALGVALTFATRS